MAAKRTPAKKVKPFGEPLDWTEADLERLSEVTPEDEASAKAFWRAKTGGKIKRLLDARPRKRKS